MGILLSRTYLRVLIPILVFIALLFGAVAIYLSQPGCSASTSCVQSTILIASLITAVGITLLMILGSTPARRQIQQLTQIARRIEEGDIQARMLPAGQDEMSNLTRAFNDMTDFLRQTIAQLQEENQQFSTLLTNLSDGVVITDERGIVRLINPAASRLLEPMNIIPIGRSFAEVVRHHQLIELWQKSSKSDQEETEAVEISRDQFWQVVVTPFEANTAKGYLVILQDLTDIHKLQTIRRDFISNLSHELRTPLASLKAVIETLENGALDDPPAAKRFLNRGANEVDVLTQMVEELLELSRIESGQVPFRFSTTAVSTLLLTPMDRLRPLASRKNIELQLDVQAQLPSVLADEERVQRVITNLLHNAIKFTPEEGIITVHAYQEKHTPDFVTISVSDTGLGIAPTDVARIFERFFKSDRARTRNGGGTGLGLAISRHIVQAHHGEIWVKSKEGKGSTFYFTLPTATFIPDVP